MELITIFITRYVDEHEPAVRWYEQLFGRPFDGAPMDSCREWQLAPGVLFQLIEDPARNGEQVTFAFRVDDLAAERDRLAGSGVELPPEVRVDGFDDLHYAELADPEGLPIGLLQGG